MLLALFCGWATFLAILCAAGLLVAQSDQRVMTNAVSRGLLACFDAAASTNALPIAAEQIRAVIQTDLSSPDGKHLLPSFVKSNEVLIASRAAPKDSDDVICAVRLGAGKFCVVKGNRVSAILDERSLSAWPHRSL